MFKHAAVLRRGPRRVVFNVQSDNPKQGGTAEAFLKKAEALHFAQWISINGHTAYVSKYAYDNQIIAIFINGERRDQG